MEKLGMEEKAIKPFRKMTIEGLETTKQIKKYLQYLEKIIEEITGISYEVFSDIISKEETVERLKGFWKLFCEIERKGISLYTILHRDPMQRENTKNYLEDHPTYL